MQLQSDSKFCLLGVFMWHFSVKFLCHFVKTDSSKHIENYQIFYHLKEYLIYIFLKNMYFIMFIYCICKFTKCITKVDIGTVT